MANPTLTIDEIDDVIYAVRVNEVDELKTVLTELSQKYQTEPKHILEASIDPDNGNNVLHYCAANGLTDLFPVLATHLSLPTASTAPIPTSFLNRPNAQGSTPLHWAALNGHLEIVKLLVAAGADMWAKNAAGHLAMFEAERADKGDVVQFLLEAGGKDVERTGREGGVSEEDLNEMREEEVGDEGDVKMSLGDTS